MLAPAIVSFSPTPEFPEIAEAQAFLTALAATDEVMRIVDQRQRRLKLQTSYGHALAMFRGFSSDETKAAFTKAEQMLAGINDPTERYLAYYGLWLPSASRGDLASARATAETFLHDAASANRMTETAIAHALLGFTCWIQGDFDSALTHLHDAIRICDPRRDREAALRFNALDAGAWASLYLAIALWLRGEVERADETIKDARQRAIECAHAPVLAQHYDFEGMFEALRGDAEAVRRAAELCIEVGQEHGIAVFLSEGIGYLGWARAKLGEREAGIAQLNECISAHVEQGNRAFIPFFQGLLAEIEGQEGDPQAGLSRIDAAIALTNEMGARWCDAFLLHIRGKILLHCDPENTAPAEEAFCSAIDIAQRQETKSLELRAALALAKLYQASNRTADAQAVLGPAIENFSPTSEFPEIQEARTLLRAST